MTKSNNLPVVIDISTRLTMVGFAGEVAPRFVWPTVVGYSIDHSMIDSDSSVPYKIGKYALDSLSPMLVYPLKAGIIEDWDAIEAILAFTFKSLEIKSSESKVLITESISSPPETHQHLMQLMFHKFGVSHLYVTLRQVLALYAVRKGSGVVIDFEPDYALIVPIFEGLAIPHVKEILNLPVITGFELSFLAERLIAAVENTNPDIYDDLYSNIVLTGSSTTTPQFRESLEKEIAERIASDRNFSIIDIPEKLYMAWIGGSRLANVSSFNEVWMSRTEFTQK